MYAICVYICRKRLDFLWYMIYYRGCHKLSFLHLCVMSASLGSRPLPSSHAGLGLLQPRLIPGNHVIKGRNLPLPLVVAPCRPEACQLLSVFLHDLVGLARLQWSLWEMWNNEKHKPGPELKWTCLGKVGLTAFWWSLCYCFYCRVARCHYAPPGAKWHRHYAWGQWVTTSRRVSSKAFKNNLVAYLIMYITALSFLGVPISFCNVFIPMPSLMCCALPISFCNNRKPA